MIDFKDRQPTEILENGALRYAVYNEDGNFNRHEYLKIDDSPLEEGTPINRVTLKKIACAENLLDNWDFTNPVNQRETTEKTAGAPAVPTIDRWRLGAPAGDGKIIVNSGNVKLECSGSWINFAQFVDMRQRFSGKTVTFSVKGSGNYNVCIRANNVFRAQENYNSDVVGIAKATCTLPDTITELTMIIRLTDNTEATLYSAKLEIGDDTSLENEPPTNYYEQLQKCQRYFFRGRLSSSELSSWNSTHKIRIYYGLNFPQQMRIVPTVTSPAGALGTGSSGNLEPIHGLTENGLSSINLSVSDSSQMSEYHDKYSIVIQANADLLS